LDSERADAKKPDTMKKKGPTESERNTFMSMLHNVANTLFSNERNSVRLRAFVNLDGLFLERR